MPQDVEQSLNQADIAQRRWAGEITRLRLKRIAKVPQELVKRCEDLVGAIQRPNSSDSEKLASEILPLAAACRFTAKVGRRALAPTSSSWFSGVWWMGRVSVQICRDPWGTVLIIAPSNYPLFLPGVQIIQALAAGNAVVVKPAPGGETPMKILKECIVATGIDPQLIQILPSSIEACQEAMQHGVDKVFLTGSLHTGRAVLRELADTATPSTMELSGCDAAFILPKADLNRAAKSIAYALRLNGGATCIAPRRIFVTRQEMPQFLERLQTELEAQESRAYEVAPPAFAATQRAVTQALSKGASILMGSEPDSKTGSEAVSQSDSETTQDQATPPTMTPIVLTDVKPSMEVARTDLFAPITSIIQVEDMAAALAADQECPYSLGAAVFGPASYADHWSQQIQAGCVVINDVVVPTADPRVPFGGRHSSGWGVTRGLEGLLEMTCIKSICKRNGKWMPHLDPQLANDTKMLAGILATFYSATLRERWNALREMVDRVRSQPNKKKAK